MRVFYLFLILALLLTSPVPATAQKQINDDEIHDAVMRRLANDRDVKGGGIDVEVSSGVVTLRGKVREEKQKARAEHLAKKVKGVTKVVNELHAELAAQGPAQE
jgi:osmotically-inducible protein OsmY